MSYFTQMAGLAYHNFFSAAVGIAVAIALVRGIARRESKTIGNFWVDTTRTCLYVLIPICIVYALALVSQGVIQNLHPYTVAHTLEHQTQTIAQGPVASQEAIKSWAPMVAASSMPTALILSKIRTRSATSSRCFPSSSSARRSPSPSAA